MKLLLLLELLLLLLWLLLILLRLLLVLGLLLLILRLLLILWLLLILLLLILLILLLLWLHWYSRVVAHVRVWPSLLHGLRIGHVGSLALDTETADADAAEVR